jgi:hypothetical protein
MAAKLKDTRDRASEKAGRRVEGQKGHTRGNATLVALAKPLAADRASSGYIYWPRWTGLSDGFWQAFLGNLGQATDRGGTKTFRKVLQGMVTTASVAVVLTPSQPRPVDVALDPIPARFHNPQEEKWSPHFRGGDAKGRSNAPQKIRFPFLPKKSATFWHQP